MKIDCISDLHGVQPKLEGGDLLIVAGDLTANDSMEQHIVFCHWLLEQKYKKIVYVAGNHDGKYQQYPLKGFYLSSNTVDKSHISYLFDSGTEFEGLKIWGSPWTPTFYNWHFMKDRGEQIKEKWDLIPQDTDILITHGPPFGILDTVPQTSPYNQGNHAGCEELLKGLERIQPRLHVFGHIHEGYGMFTLKAATQDILFVNASIMNGDYRPTNKPITVNL